MLTALSSLSLVQAERQRLLAIIEEGFGSIHGFNQTVRHILAGIGGARRSDGLAQESEAHLRGFRLWQHTAAVTKARATACSGIQQLLLARAAGAAGAAGTGGKVRPLPSAAPNLAQV